MAEAKLDKYERRLQTAKEKKELFDKKQELRDIKKSMRRWRAPTKTELIMAFILLNCTAVEVYSMIVMVVMWDLSALYSLITAVVTESLSFAIYAAKAYAGKKQEEAVKLERERMEYDHTAPQEHPEKDPEYSAA